MTRARSLAGAGAAFALAFTIAGCGGDSGLSAEDFRKQADAICTDFQDESKDLFAGISASSTEEDLVAAFKKAADLLEEQSDKIAELEPPESIADDVDAMLTSLRDGAKEIRDNGMELIQSGENPLADASEKAKDLELNTCGSMN